MKKKIKNYFWIAVWVVLFLVTGNFSILGQIFPEKSEAQEVSEDVFMDTTSYSTEIEVQDNNSYLVRENIDVGSTGIFRRRERFLSLKKMEK